MFYNKTTRIGFIISLISYIISIILGIFVAVFPNNFIQIIKYLSEITTEKEIMIYGLLIILYTTAGLIISIVGLNVINQSLKITCGIITIIAALFSTLLFAGFLAGGVLILCGKIENKE